MEFLLDTNACIAVRALLAGNEPRSAESRRKLDAFRQRWQQVDGKALAMSLITLGELEFGASKSTAAHARALLASLRAAVSVLVPDDTVAAKYGEVRHALESRGQAIGPNDTWIAAHGLARQLTLVTDNVSEFKRVAGLKLDNWTV